MNEWTDWILIPVTFQGNTVRRLKMFLKTFFCFTDVWSLFDTHTKTHTQKAFKLNFFNLMQRQLQHVHVYSLHNLPFASLFFIRQAPINKIHIYRLSIRCLVWLHRLGQTNVLSSDIKDGEVLPDEDISQDPELVRATLAKASVATVVVLWRDKRK